MMHCKLFPPAPFPCWMGAPSNTFPSPPKRYGPRVCLAPRLRIWLHAQKTRKWPLQGKGLCPSGSPFPFQHTCTTLCLSTTNAHRSFCLPVQAKAGRIPGPPPKEYRINLLNLQLQDVSSARDPSQKGDRLNSAAIWLVLVLWNFQVKVQSTAELQLLGKGAVCLPAVPGAFLEMPSCELLEMVCWARPAGVGCTWAKLLALLGLRQ